MQDCHSRIEIDSHAGASRQGATLCRTATVEAPRRSQRSCGPEGEIEIESRDPDGRPGWRRAGRLVDFNKRLSHHFGYGISYTWSKALDNGPNPSFVLIPQNTFNFRAEKALSADDVRHRFVANATFAGPTNINALVNNWQLSTIMTFESPHHFTKFAGLDTNGDGFTSNDRVGIEPRNTFKGDSYQSVDLRISRSFKLGDRFNLQALAESFNTLNTVNIRFYNTTYTAPDFLPVGTPGTFLGGSPNPNYGTPRAIFNPRQIQLALRLTF